MTESREAVTSVQDDDICTFMGRVWDNKTHVAFGNAVRCKPGAELDDAMRKILIFNFEFSRKESEYPEFRAVKEPELIVGEDYIDVLGSGKSYRNIGWFAVAPRGIYGVLDDEGNFPPTLDDWNSPEDAEYDNA